MKVLIIARGYPTEKYKLNGIFEFDQAKALVEAGIKVVYAAVDMRSIRRWRKWGYESFVKDGVQVEVINLPCGRIPRRILDKVSESALNKLYSIIVNKYGKHDIIHSHFISLGYITAKCFKNSNIPLIHTEHYSGMNKKKLSEYYKNLGNSTYCYMDRVIAVGSHLANNINDNFGIEPIIIPNIVDTSIFKYVHHENNNESFNFIAVGNLLENKRMDLLINCFNLSFKDKKNVNLYIYGDGPERKRLKKLIDELNIANKVFLMGLVDRFTIADKMQKCQCFVLVSRTETFGVAYVEAMLSGLPVIATKCGGPEDFVDESNGMLINVDSRDELKNALLYMYNNSKQYINEEISKDTIKKYSSHNIAKIIISEYHKVLKGKI